MIFSVSKLFRPELLARTVRFAAAGAATTLFYFLATNLLLFTTTIEPLVASILAYCASAVLSYLLQSRLVFRYAGDQKAASLRFVALTIFGLVFSQALFVFVTSTLGRPAWVATCVVSIAIPIINFIAMSLWVFVCGSSGRGPASSHDENSQVDKFLTDAN